MLYKRISNTLCFALCLSTVVTHNTYTITMPTVSTALKSGTDTFLNNSDKFANFFGFTDTKSLAKVSVFLLGVIPLLHYLTDGKKFNHASSDEELSEAMKILKQKPSARSISGLIRELCYKLVRMIRSKIGHRSYLITIKEERTKNSDGSTNSITELKTVSPTGLCKHIEDSIETLAFLINSAAGMHAVQKFAESLDEYRFVGMKDEKVLPVKTH